LKGAKEYEVEEILDTKVVRGPAMFGLYKQELDFESEIGMAIASLYTLSWSQGMLLG
ncbi:hypothetical protein L0F63_005169, partial [Massospora cicadina]